MKLVHFSSWPVTQLFSRSAILQQPGFKPVGLWVSDEDDLGWREWAVDAGFPPHTFAFEHSIKLAPKANILYLRSARDIDDFTQNMQMHSASKGKLADSLLGMHIDWQSVAKIYQGIIITPYIWERRLTSHSFWYYAWDCASGCIWDTDAIADIKLIRTKKIKSEERS